MTHHIIIVTKKMCQSINMFHEYSFQIDVDIPEIEVFVYSRKVHDFQKIDYQSLYCLNISATYELYKIIQKQQVQIIHNCQRFFYFISFDINI